ncbi:MAG: hypothetical protein P8N59_07595 [Planktomarina sp.]|nr:hypothetical protein [Planktomarina sp.]
MTHPFDNAMIAVRAHVELGQFKEAQTSATRAWALAPKPAGHPPIVTDTSGLDGKNIWRSGHRPLKQYQQDFLFDHSYIDQPTHRRFANHPLDSQ